MENQYKSLSTWVNGNKQLTGTWTYSWVSDSFVIKLDQYDKITGQQKVFRVHGDKPEWGN